MTSAIGIIHIEQTLSIKSHKPIIPWNPGVLLYDGRVVCKEKHNSDLVRDMLWKASCIDLILPKDESKKSDLWGHPVVESLWRSFEHWVQEILALEKDVHPLGHHGGFLETWSSYADVLERYELILDFCLQHINNMFI